ncbi:MAG: histidinol-phosphate transaminase [Patulibacter sp.]|nr:histidinol-phosphate transaminase [Patulibacter sp.]
MSVNASASQLTNDPSPRAPAAVRMRPSIATIQPYKPGKPAGAATGKRIAALASNEMPFAPSPAVREAIAQAAAGLNRYPDPHATALRERIATANGVDVDRVAVGAGSMILLQQAVLSTTGEGDELLYAWPSFEGYPLLASLAGARAVGVPLIDARHDLPAMADAISDRTRCILVCNPNNPTGTLLGRDEIAAFLARVPSDRLVILDEAYREFVDEPGYRDALTLLDEFPNVAVTRTFSKAYGLAGLRIGYCIAAPDVIATIRRSHIPFNVTALAQAGAMAALDGAGELHERLAELSAGRRRLAAHARALGYPVVDGYGNFVWLALGERAPQISALLEAEGVISRALPPFGTRISVGTPEDVDHAMQALEQVASAAEPAG